MSDENINLEKMLEKLKSELYLEYEYAPVKKYPTKFCTGLELLNKDNSNSSKTHLSQTEIPYKTSIFQPTELIKTSSGQYYYKPHDVSYSSLFECIADLSKIFPLETILTALTWQQFEDFISDSLNQYGYIAIRTFRFSLGKKRHEIDVIAREGQNILVIDAKHWNNKTASSSSLMRVAEEQILRVNHLIKNPDAAGLLLNRLHFPAHAEFPGLNLYPIILVSSVLAKNQIVNGVPIIDFMKFNEFLNNFSFMASKLQPFHLSKVVTQRKLS